jgi:hypothetical protein
LWIADWHTFAGNVRLGANLQSAISSFHNRQSRHSTIGNAIGNRPIDNPIGNRQSKSAIGNRKSVNLQSAIAILQSVRAACPL